MSSERYSKRKLKAQEIHQAFAAGRIDERDRDRQLSRMNAPEGLRLKAKRRIKRVLKLWKKGEIDEAEMMRHASKSLKEFPDLQSFLDQEKAKPLATHGGAREGAGGRSVDEPVRTTSVNLTASELAKLDRLRGDLSRSRYLGFLIQKEKE